jgi:hypothetical protein
MNIRITICYISWREAVRNSPASQVFTQKVSSRSAGIRGLITACDYAEPVTTAPGPERCPGRPCQRARSQGP